MKKKVIKMIMTLTLLFIIFFSSTPSTASAACPPHKNYKDYTTGTSSIWYTYHDYVCAYKVNPNGVLVPVYDTCSVVNYMVFHSVICGECNTAVGQYNQPIENHKNCGK